jgi:glucokinase
MEAPGGLAIGVDIGGTRLRAGLVSPDGGIVARSHLATPARDAEAITRLAVELVTEVRNAHEVGAARVGVGAAGLIDLDGVVRFAPNVEWADYPLREVLAKRLGVPVTVDNDANAAAWGEYRAGAGVDARSSLLMLTIGTGVGGGLVEANTLMRGANGLGAELGHIIVQEGGPLCGCGNRGCLEALASGNAIGRVAREALAAGEAPADSALVGLDEVTGKAVTVAAEAGDAFAAEVLARCGFWLGVGMASLVNALDPEIVVLGGGGIQAGEFLLGPAREAFTTRVIGRAHRTLPPIVRAQLGDDAGLVGAALLALAEPLHAAGEPSPTRVQPAH